MRGREMAGQNWWGLKEFDANEPTSPSQILQCLINFFHKNVEIILYLGSSKILAYFPHVNCK